MKILVLLAVLNIGICSLSCDICLKLAEYRFDYTPLITSNACENDSTCESILKELSWRFIAKGYASSPCLKTPTGECRHFGALVCDDIVGEVCSTRLSVAYKDSAKKTVSNLKGVADQLESELKKDLFMYKQKFLDLLEKYNEVDKIVE